MLGFLHSKTQQEVGGGVAANIARGTMEHLFIADTNLFFEAHRLEDLPWAELGVDPIVIGLTKPVQGEIDRHKNGTGRTKKRALETFKRVRTMLQAGQSEAVIREANPRVILRLMAAVRPDPALAEDLDLATVDDKLVAIVSALSKTDDFASVQVMTDDAGVGMTAQMVDVPCHLIDDTWKRPPAPSDKDRQIDDLKKDLAAYRAQEPVIEIEDVTDAEASPHAVRRVPDALTRAQVDTLVDCLERAHPKTTDFTVPDTVVEEDGTEISYIASSAEKIEAYTATAYPNWLTECRDRLERLAEGREEKEPSIMLRFAMRNAGTRPASKVRVTFETAGDVAIIRRFRDTEDDTEEAPSSSPSVLSLPKPPAPPKAEKVVKRPPKPQPAHATDLAKLSRSATGGLRATDLGLNIPGSALHDIGLAASAFADLDRSGVLGALADQHSAIGSALAFQREHDRIKSLYEPPSYASILSPDRYAHLEAIKPRLPHIPKHDPEGFYFDEWPEGRPVRSGGLTCDLFRHQGEAEIFDVEVLFPEDGDVTGSVLCRVQAENLTEPVQLRVSVSRTIETFDLMNVAEGMVEALAE